MRAKRVVAPTTKASVVGFTPTGGANAPAKSRGHAATRLGCEQGESASTPLAAFCGVDAFVCFCCTHGNAARAVEGAARVVCQRARFRGCTGLGQNSRRLLILATMIAWMRWLVEWVFRCTDLTRIAVPTSTESLYRLDPDSARMHRIRLCQSRLWASFTAHSHRERGHVCTA
jgi:hypothetical protein